MRPSIDLKEAFAKNKIKLTLEKIKEPFQETIEKFYEQLVKNTYPSTIINNSKSYINKFVRSEGLIYLKTRKLRKTIEYSVE